MDNIYKLLDKFNLCGSCDESLDFPHIVYERKAYDDETVISYNFIVKYCDLVKHKFIDDTNLEKTFYDFERKYFSKYFFREDTDLKWNYYLIIIVNEDESVDYNICQLEQDDKYLRKLVMTVAEFEIYIGHSRNIKDSSGQMISAMDTYAEWQKELSEAGLEGILTYSYESVRVQYYIEKGIPIRSQGRPIRNWKNTGKGNPRFLVKKIEAVSLDSFRSHCLTNYREIPLANVNLFSGCNGAGKSSICSAIEYALTGEVLDSKKENGKTRVRIKNRDDLCASLDSTKLTKDKKALDQLWYGTVTTGRNSSLNRNFHTFNYLGLEASGRYMQELDINELVKNVLFGVEVTEAELKMQRYGRAFVDKRKEYGKRLKEISKEIDNIKVDYEVKGISMEDIADRFQELGYKKEFNLKNQTVDNFLEKCRMILCENDQYTEILSLKCGKSETGISIMEKMKKLDEAKEAYKSLKNKREKLAQDIQDAHQKYEDNRVLFAKLYEKTQNVQILIQFGAEWRNVFFSKEDFLLLKNEYEKNSNIKKELTEWLDQYHTFIYSEGDETELNNKIQVRELNISELNNEIKEIIRQIGLQKKQNHNIDTIIQEMLNLAEQYSVLNKYAENCPVCGTSFSSREKLLKAINAQKEFRVIDENILEIFLKQKVEKEGRLDKEKEALNLLKEEREKVLQKRIAISKLKGIMPIDEIRSGKDILRKVLALMSDIQKELEYNINKYEYVQKVLRSTEFIDYSENVEWIGYLENFLQSLEDQKAVVELMLRTQADEEKELEQKYQRAMEEKVIFIEQEWEEARLKANGFQALKQEWGINENAPIMCWIDEYNVFRQEIQYAEEIYGKQEALKYKKEQIRKFEEERRIIQNWIQKCQTACEVIERQKRLEDVMKEFLKENAKQIELFFKLLHRPKEFGKLSIDNGNIRFVRNSNGQFAESGQMSTGQRMALAFSVMITLHISAANAPNLLMLDEPVANLDDMHVLNLIDLLRELALSGTQIIMTTADSQMAKFLRRKFSFLKEEYSHFELTRKGDAQTLIDIIHYSPDIKEEKVLPLSSI